MHCAVSSMTMLTMITSFWILAAYVTTRCRRSPRVGPGPGRGHTHTSKNEDISRYLYVYQFINTKLSIFTLLFFLLLLLLTVMVGLPVDSGKHFINDQNILSYTMLFTRGVVQNIPILSYTMLFTRGVVLIDEREAK